MTEDDIKKLEAEVLGDAPVDAKFEIEYLGLMKRDHEAEIKKVQANFRMFKYTRDDEKLAQCEKAIKKLRESVTYFDMRISELLAAIGEKG